MNIECSGCRCWNENKALFRAQTHVLSGSGRWTGHHSWMVTKIIPRAQPPHPCLMAMKPDGHDAIPCTTWPCSSKHREKGKVFLSVCTHIPTGFGCLQAVTWRSKPSTILDLAHDLQWILICPMSLLICSRICKQESSSATQIQTRQWRDAQGYRHML